ncbi:MAG TPA: hypothetical protein VLI07_04155 [Candidatus Binatus sp.]|jgi:hypothetical protein|nr:hypothetical protein [Candidatus Binatus sp.]
MMGEFSVGVIVFASVFGGALGGTFIRDALPKHHLSSETENVVKLGTGVIATMSALIVGLLLASAKGSFDTRNNELNQLWANLILIDHQLERYGPETKEARDLLRRYTALKIDALWPSEASHPVSDAGTVVLMEDIQDKLRALAPQNDAQRWLKERALELSGDVVRIRWLLREQSEGTIPVPFLLILVLWLAIIFTSFGLFAPRNTTVIAALFVCSLSVAGAIFLVLELDQPFGGLIRISSVPARDALAHLGQ